MLRYGIGALLIILIITITLSYQYNAEGFLTAAQQAAAARAAAQPAAAGDSTVGGYIVSGSGSGSGTGTGTTAVGELDVAANAPDPSRQNIVGDLKRSVIDLRPSSSATQPTNTQNYVTLDKVNINVEPKGKHLRVFANAQLLKNGTSQKYWLVTENPDPNSSQPVIPIWRYVFVTNDPKFESAAIPEANYAPYVGQTAYLVPRGSLNIDDSIGTFIIPSPPGKPTVVNPKVSVSDTGYDAMKLNKHSNLLNDIQKIIHNEMLANRSLDVIVKNPNNRGSAAAGPAAAKAIAQLPPKLQEKARKQMQNNNSCNGSCGGTCNTCKSDNDPDMSKYIRKDQIPCWGCSLDY